MKQSDQIKSLLIELFEKLNNSKTSYAVLRGFEDLPHKISHDIDFCIAPKDLDEAYEIIDKVMNKNKYVKVQFSSRQGFSQVYYYGEDGCLKLDFWTSFKFRGLVYLDVEEILHNTKKHNDITVLNESAELTVSFLKEFLHNGVMREDKISSLSLKAKNVGFLLEGSCKNKIFEGEKYREKLRNQNLDFSTLSKKFTRGLIFYNLTQVGILNTFYSICEYFFKFILDKLIKRNFFIALLGPDGSGKTTIAQLLLDDVSQKKSSFTDVKYIHGRWGFIPNLGSLKGNSRQVVSSLEFDTVENSEERIQSKIRTSVYMGYYFIDYLMGSLKLIFFRGQNCLTIADRYFYDYFIAEQCKNYPKIFKFIYLKLLKSPDLIVYLEADAKIIRARKPELSINKIQTQQERIISLIKKIPNTIKIETNSKNEGISELKTLINRMRMR